MHKEKIIIYTDGAAKGNPGKAGWAAVILLEQNSGGRGRIYEMGGRVEHATNNQMELTAPIEALKQLKKIDTQASPVYNLEIFSDSKYVILGITEWIFNWQKNNWRNAAKKPVLNRELWGELYELTKKLKPKWTYVKGHNEDKWNERADAIATSFASGEPVELKKL
jgi:ribonuclease HI